jgi:hypothetical protein
MFQKIPIESRTNRKFCHLELVPNFKYLHKDCVAFNPAEYMRHNIRSHIHTFIIMEVFRGI